MFKDYSENKRFWKKLNHFCLSKENMHKKLIKKENKMEKKKKNGSLICKYNKKIEINIKKMKKNIRNKV